MRCKAFDYEDPHKAWEHMEFKIIKDYGGYAYGHNLHTWDEGERLLARCKKCGGYILIQYSEFHGYDDSYYRDYFPVEDEQDAEEKNKMYDGFQLESDSGLKYLIRDGGCCHWSKPGEV